MTNQSRRTTSLSKEMKAKISAMAWELALTGTANRLKTRRPKVLDAAWTLEDLEAHCGVGGFEHRHECLTSTLEDLASRSTVDTDDVIRVLEQAKNEVFRLRARCGFDQPKRLRNLRSLRETLSKCLKAAVVVHLDAEEWLTKALAPLPPLEPPEPNLGPDEVALRRAFDHLRARLANAAEHGPSALQFLGGEVEAESVAEVSRPALAYMRALAALENDWRLNPPSGERNSRRRENPYQRILANTKDQLRRCRVPVRHVRDLLDDTGLLALTGASRLPRRSTRAPRR